MRCGGVEPELPDALDVAEPALASIELRTVVLIGRREDLPSIAAPGFDVATLREYQACP